MIEAILSGEDRAASFLEALRSRCAQGDELFAALAELAPPMSGDTEAQVRGFARTVQKALATQLEALDERRRS